MSKHEKYRKFKKAWLIQIQGEHKEPIFRVCLFLFKLNGLLFSVVSPPARQIRELVEMSPAVCQGWVIKILELSKVSGAHGSREPSEFGETSPGNHASGLTQRGNECSQHSVLSSYSDMLIRPGLVVMGNAKTQSNGMK